MALQDRSSPTVLEPGAKRLAPEGKVGAVAGNIFQIDLIHHDVLFQRLDGLGQQVGGDIQDDLFRKFIVKKIGDDPTSGRQKGAISARQFREFLHVITDHGVEESDSIGSCDLDLPPIREIQEPHGISHGLVLL